ncbi:MAG: hypothetical protein HZA54_11010 [Planctomycetes bacterium]|nr:hypothetical protein [Planctomycetota bacterium]
MFGKSLFPFVAAILMAVVLWSAGALRADDPKKAAAPEPKCDLAKLETIQRCGDCGSEQENGKCSCGKPKECTCKTKRIEVPVCVKDFYQCTECGNQQFKGGKCQKCGKRTEEKKDKADVIYVCKEDSVEQAKPGKCEKCKKNLTKTCRKSGNFPHVQAK